MPIRPVLVLAVAALLAGCGHSSAGSGGGRFTLTNDTTSVVQVNDCLPARCDSATATTLAPAKSAKLALSGRDPASAVSMLVITGDGAEQRCLLIPPALPEQLHLTVSNADPANCGTTAPVPAPS